MATPDSFSPVFTDRFGGPLDPEPPPFVPPRDTVDFPSVAVWRFDTGLDWVKVGRVKDYSTLSFVPTFQDAGNWTITVPWDTGAILLPGRVVTIDWRGVRSTWLIEEWHPARGLNDTGNQTPTLTVSGGNAKAMLKWELVWPDATNTLDAQPVYVDTKPAPYKASAEAVCRRFIVENFVTRYGAPLNVAPSLGRGDVVPARPKFDNMFEMVQKLVKDGGIDWTIGLENSTDTRAQLWLRFVKPADKSKKVRLKSSTKTIAAWEQVDTIPTATSALVGYGPDSNGAQSSLAGDVSATAGSVTVDSSKSFPDPSGDNPHFRIVIGDETLRVRGFSRTKLNGSVSSTATTITVASNADFPTITGGLTNFPITVGSEVMRVTGGASNNTWNVERGVGASKATSHSDKEDVVATRTWVVDRGVGSTVPEAHDAGDPVRGTRTYKIVSTSASNDSASRWVPWGGGIATYVAGPDSSDQDEVDASGRASLSDGAESRALSVVAAERPGAQAFTDFDVPDIVAMEIETGAVENAPVSSIEVTVDENGISVKPTIGNPGAINSHIRQAQFLRSLARKVRRLEKD